MEQIIEMLNSADIADFDLAVALLANDGIEGGNLSKFLTEHLDKQYSFSISSQEVTRNTRYGLWEQMNNGGFVHVYDPTRVLKIETIK
jgi:hypothetical protein